MYTRSELEGFWDSILINAASRTAPKKFFFTNSQNRFVYTTDQEGRDGSHYCTPQTELFVDKMISPGCFKDQFLNTFGPVVYVLEHCRIYFSVFLFIKLNIDMVVMIVRYMEISKLTGSILGFGKTLLTASYNIFLTSILTSMYNPCAPAPTAVEHMDVSPCVEKYMQECKR